MELDQYQMEAVENRDRKVLLIAPPGSGKTTVLIKKIEEVMKEGTPPGRILVLTFSKAAAVNMGDRFIRTGLDSPWFGTIHAFCYKELAKKKKIQIITTKERFLSLREMILKYHLSPDEVDRLIGEISRRKSKQYSSVESNNFSEELFPPYFINEAEKCYKNFKGANELYDFDDLEEGLIEMLKDGVFLENLRKSFDWIMVDEFQDLNYVQLKILQEISTDSYFFAVGDEDQCIYEFRGSNTDAMVNFPEYFKDGKKLYLKYNYRSSETIVSCANTIICNNVKRNQKSILNKRMDKTSIQIRKVLDEKASAEAVSKMIGRIPKTETTAVIVRTNKEMEAIMRTLSKAGITFSLIEKPYDIYGGWIIKDLTAFMEFAIFNRREPLLRIMDKAGLGISKEVKEEIRNNYFKTPAQILLDSCDKSYKKEEVLSFIEKLDKLKKMKPENAVDWILYGLKYSRFLEMAAFKNNTSIHGYIAEIKDFKDRISFFDSIADLIEWLIEYRRIMELKQDTMDKVVLTTMHGSKGMEFDNVFIMNAVEGNIPHERSLKGDEGERRLFYVAVTRAKNDLYIIVPKKINGTARQISEYIMESSLVKLV